VAADAQDKGSIGEGSGTEYETVSLIEETGISLRVGRRERGMVGGVRGEES
jgi:hypothetical protein